MYTENNILESDTVLIAVCNLAKGESIFLICVYCTDDTMKRTLEIRGYLMSQSVLVKNS